MQCNAAQSAMCYKLTRNIEGFPSHSIGGTYNDAEYLKIFVALVSLGYRSDFQNGFSKMYTVANKHISILLFCRVKEKVENFHFHASLRCK